MHTYLLTPLAPLVLRKGKPFGETGGGESFDFPFPTTVAGTLRAARADMDKRDFDKNRETITGWQCAGILPALIDLNKEGQTEALFPKPQDALYLDGGEAGKQLLRLAPMAMVENEGCDLPGSDLLPVFHPGEENAKPVSGPAWWCADVFTRWLLGGEAPTVDGAGPKPPPQEIRTHVSLDPKTLAASDGLLYQSAGPDWEAPRRATPGAAQRGWESRRFGLLARFAEPIEPTLVRLGGEGRLSALSAVPSSTWPAMPEDLAATLEREGRFRLIFCSPALFDVGWRPGWLDANLEGDWPNLPGLKVKLRAAVLERWQAISGWDIRAQKPKAARRLVPAGAVYWFEVDKDVKPPPGWAAKLWLQSVCDKPEDRRDGFGLTVPGRWIDLAKTAR